MEPPPTHRDGRHRVSLNAKECIGLIITASGCISGVIYEVNFWTVVVILIGICITEF